jgi:ribonuclease III
MTSPDFAALEKILQVEFKNPALLRQALTHSTYQNEHPELGPHNERLEFVGDAVLNLLAARLVHDRFAEANEGVLSRRRAAVVRSEALAAIGKELGLADYLMFGEGQRKAGVADGGRLLADACEALAGALYLDSGFAAAEACFAPLLEQALEREGDGVDWKTELQELCHARGLGMPRYTVVSISGPDHARTYNCEVSVAGEIRGQGAGRSKKAAEQLCAEAALIELGARRD